MRPSVTVQQAYSENSNRAVLPAVAAVDNADWVIPSDRAHLKDLGPTAFLADLLDQLPPGILLKLIAVDRAQYDAPRKSASMTYYWGISNRIDPQCTPMDDALQH